MMGGTPERERVEAEIRGHHRAGRLDQAATCAIRHYGPEILGFLIAVARDEELATESFSRLCEDLWAGLPGFRWDASFRTWTYVLARHALAHARRDRNRRPEHLPLSRAPELAAAAARVRTTTLVHLRTETRDAVAELRRALDPDDRALLILRIDRRLSWNDVARVLAGEAEDEVGLRRASATMRKRYQRIVDELRDLARERGLL